jgi:beta-glucosidase
MTSFNKVNGDFVSNSKPYVNDTLRKEFGWDGVVISDWTTIHDTALSMNAGLDLEIPTADMYGPAAVTTAMQAGAVTQDTVDQAVKRLLRLMIRTGLADDPPAPRSTIVDCPEHRALALKAAEEGITLLKNEGGILPLDPAKVKSIAVIGPNALDTQIVGRWSANSPSFYKVSVLDAIVTKAGPGTVAFSQGCNRTGDTPNYLIREAVTLAARSVQAVAAVNPRTIVVLNNGTPLLMNRWLNSVPVLLEAWYSGQECGNAIANILFGDVNPSGHLTCTIARRREDYSDWPNYPGVDGYTKYAEGIYVGYRHFDKNHIAPLFPFGFGLSYTTFRYGLLDAPSSIKRGAGAEARVSVKNVGSRSGDAVVQLYVRDLHPDANRPIRELKGFSRVHLEPGEEKQVSIPIAPDAFSYWDSALHAWLAEPGNYAIDVGDSSRDIALSATVHLL